MRFKACVVAMTFVMVLGSIASAQTVETVPSVAVEPVPTSPPARLDDITGTVGLGVGFAPDYEGSEDYGAVLVPYGRLDWRQYYTELRPSMGALQLRANVTPSSKWLAGPLLNYRRERDEVDNNRVDEFEHIDAAWELGGFVGYQIVDPTDPHTRFGINLQVAGDVSDSHNGWSIQPGIDYTTPLSRDWQLNARVFSTYVSENYMSTYFGVSSRNAARSGLDKFTADAGFKDVGLGVGLGYNLSSSWNIGTQAGYSRLVGDAADSPITDDEGSANQFFGGVIVNYRF